MQQTISAAESFKQFEQANFQLKTQEKMLKEQSQEQRRKDTMINELQMDI